MTTRSGKRYLISHKCCQYYSNKNFDYKCGGCQTNGIMTSKEFGDKCRKWAKNNTIGSWGRDFILKNKHISDQHLFNFLTELLKNTGKYISAEIGLKLFKANPSNNRGHIVGSFIADWWEIKSLMVSEDKKWPRYMDCYYGYWSNPIESWSGVNNAKIPPKKPYGPKK